MVHAAHKRGHFPLFDATADLTILTPESPKANQTESQSRNVQSNVNHFTPQTDLEVPRHTQKSILIVYMK